MQIIGGKLKGKRLLNCKSKSIRPAMGLIRKSIFDTLQDFVIDTSVLDLCAGTGILGIEALSRGAKKLTLIDSNKISTGLIRNNLKLCNLEAKVILGSLPESLNRKDITNEVFDLIFLDPPYGNSAFINEVLASIINKEIFSSKGLILIESETKSKISLPNKLKLYKEKRFGNTKITYLKPSPSCF